MEISVVIPTLNEEGNIKRVLEGVNNFMGGKYDYEIIVVDGNSNDRTVGISKAMGARVVSENVGKGYAIRKGMNEANGNIIVTIDADCSHIPEEMGMMIDGIKKGYHVCMGSRFLKGGGTEDMPWHRKFGNKIFVSIVNAIWNSKYTDMCYGYRCFSKDSLKQMNLISDGFSIETKISIKAAKRGMKVLEIPSLEKARRAGEGKLRTFRDGYKVMKIILNELRCKD